MDSTSDLKEGVFVGTQLWEYTGYISYKYEITKE